MSLSFLNPAFPYIIYFKTLIGFIALFFQLMKLMAVRRVQMATSGKSDVPLPPAPPPHPGVNVIKLFFHSLFLGTKQFELVLGETFKCNVCVHALSSVTNKAEMLRKA